MIQSELPLIARDDSYEKTMQSEDTNIQRNIIRHILCGHPEGITDMEICILTGISRTSVCARRNEIHGVTAVGLAKIMGDDGIEDRLNTLWSVE